MNKVFKVIWNHSLQCFVAVSELSRNKTKSECTDVKQLATEDNKTFGFSRLAVTLALIMAPTASSYAVVSGTITEDDWLFAPRDGGLQMVVDGSSNSLIGSFNKINRGDPGFAQIRLGDTALSSGSEYLANNIFKIGALDTGRTYHDDATNSDVTINTYDQSNFSTSAVADYMATVTTNDIANGQFVDRNFHTLTQGSSLDVNVGSTGTNWVNDAANRFDVIMKGSVNGKTTSSAFLVESDGSSDTTLNYNAKTLVSLGNQNNNIHDSTSPIFNATLDLFKGSFTSIIGQQNINSLADFKIYTAALQQAITDGVITSQAVYNQQIGLAWDSSIKSISLADPELDADDAILQVNDRNRVAYIHAAGDKALVNIGSDANIELFWSDASLVFVEDGAKVVNNGTLGTAANTAKNGAVAVRATNGLIENYGVIDAGTNPELAAYSASTRAATLGQQTAVWASGTSSVYNAGVINIASRADNSDNIGAFLVGSANMTNDGSINVASTTANSTVAGTDVGAHLQNSTVLNNNGTIYIGREAQRATSDTTNDLVVNQPSMGVRLVGNAIYNGSADSEIVIGSKVEQATAIDASANAQVNQGGTILIHGANAVSGNSTSNNTGIHAHDGAVNVVNSGTITMDGLNARGIQVDRGAKAINTGVITVDTQPSSGADRYQSAGMLVNAAAGSAVGEMSGDGTINLIGDQTIGIYALNGGEVNVSDQAHMVFSNGNHQIGYYLLGVGSTLTNTSTAVKNVSTEDSTLYRVDSGAVLSGADTGSVELNASGDNSTLAQITGVGSGYTSDASIFKITGAGATGIKVEGGATSTLSTGTIIEQISGSGTTAGIVDGKYFDITGTEIVARKGDSVLTSEAMLTSANTTGGAFGYIARNGGKLIHKGSIDFSDAGSTGVLVDGGILENSGTIKVKGTGVHVTGAASQVSNTIATASVQATDGKAAYWVDGGASLALTGLGTTSAAGTAHGILLDTGATGLTVDGATINMSATGTGSAIENVANVSGIALADTTIDVGNGIGVHTGASMAAENSGTITVNGSGTGILFENIDGTTTNNQLDMAQSQDLVINVESADGKGLVTNTSEDLNTGVSVNVQNAAGGSALIVGGTTKAVNQSGVLTSTSLTRSVVDIDNGSVTTFNNSGDITAASAAQTAVQTLSGNGVTFTNQTGGNIVGHVDLMAGNNTVNLEAGSTGTDFTTDAGDDVFNLNHLKSATANAFNSLTGGAGTDTLNMTDTNYVLNDATSLSGFENVNLTESAKLVLNDTLLALGDSQDDAATTGFNIDGTSELGIKNTTDDVNFASHLAGTGLVNIELAATDDKSFNFTSNNAADGFEGTVALAHAKMELAGLNTQALSDATLRLDGGSKVHVGAGEQVIGSMKINGGTLAFDSGTPGETVAQGSVTTTNNLDLSGTGAVQVSKGSVSNDIPLAPTLISILAQDDANTLVQLAKSTGTTTGSGGALVLKDQDGNVISSSTSADIAQNSSTVAKGTYDYRLTSGDSSDGLYINYGLTQVELLGAGTDALALNATGMSGNAADLSAKVTGAGDLAIDTGAGNTVSLSNTLNDYTGNTDIRSGNLLMVADNVLGKTDVLSLAADTSLDMNGKAQTVGFLQSAANSQVNLNGGALSLSHGGVSDGELTGAGELNVLADTLTVNGANSGLSATTTVENGATVALNDVAGLGIGDIVNAGKVVFSDAVGTVVNSIRDGVAGTTRALSATAGSVDLVNSQLVLDGDNSGFSGVFNIDSASELTASEAKQLGTATIEDAGSLVLNSATDWLLVNDVNGAGSLTKQGAGVVTLSGNAAYTGLTDIQAGGLMLGSEATPLDLASTQVNVAQGAFLAGYGGVAGNVDNQGTLYVGAQNESGAAQTFTVGQDLVNSGTVNIGHGSVAGNTLNVNGNYTGNGGLINFNTVLGDDNSVTDKLVVAGNTSGTTDVSVTNAGGSGAQTLNGIELISVGGQSDGEFAQSGRIVAGAYDYALVRGAGDNSANWYLTNDASPASPVDPTDPVDPGTPTDPEDKTPEPTVRPEAGAYTANLAAANTMFINRLHDRLGETQYTDALTGEEKVTSLWLRNVGGHTASRDNSGQLQTQSNRYVMQMGGEVAQWSTDGLNRLHLGVMAGYGNSHSNTRSHATGYSADGSVNGYSTGMYATWYDNDAEKNGLYVDTWAQYSWFDNKVSGEKLATESYKSKGVTASVETGYTFNMGEFKGSKGTTNTWYIQPQAQAIWMGVEADDHTEANGTRVQGGGDGNVMTRLGARAYLKSHTAADEGKGREFQPFVEANWIHNTNNFSTTMDGVNSSQAGTRNIGEVKVGVEGQLNQNLNLWGNVGVQVGDKGYNDSAATIGVKYSFK